MVSKVREMNEEYAHFIAPFYSKVREMNDE